MDTTEANTIKLADNVTVSGMVLNNFSVAQDTVVNSAGAALTVSATTVDATAFSTTKTFVDDTKKAQATVTLTDVLDYSDSTVTAGVSASVAAGRTFVGTAYSDTVTVTLGADAEGEASEKAVYVSTGTDTTSPNNVTVSLAGNSTTSVNTLIGTAEKADLYLAAADKAELTFGQVSVGATSTFGLAEIATTVLATTDGGQDTSYTASVAASGFTYHGTSGADMVSVDSTGMKGGETFAYYTGGGDDTVKAGKANAAIYLEGMSAKGTSLDGGTGSNELFIYGGLVGAASDTVSKTLTLAADTNESSTVLAATLAFSEDVSTAANAITHFQAFHFDTVTTNNVTVTAGGDATNGYTGLTLSGAGDVYTVTGAKTALFGNVSVSPAQNSTAGLAITDISTGVFGTLSDSVTLTGTSGTSDSLTLGAGQNYTGVKLTGAGGIEALSYATTLSGAAAPFGTGDTTSVTTNISGFESIIVSGGDSTKGVIFDGNLITASSGMKNRSLALTGGEGADTFDLENAVGNFTLTGGNGTDIYNVNVKSGPSNNSKIAIVDTDAAADTVNFFNVSALVTEESIEDRLMSLTFVLASDDEKNTTLKITGVNGEASSKDAYSFTMTGASEDAFKGDVLNFYTKNESNDPTLMASLDLGSIGALDKTTLKAADLSFVLDDKTQRYVFSK